jgi:hypothetical protein
MRYAAREVKRAAAGAITQRGVQSANRVIESRLGGKLQGFVNVAKR